MAFIVWLFGWGLRRTLAQRGLGRRLAFAATVAYFVSGMTGTGLVTSIPQSVFILLFAGWIIRYESPPVLVARGASDELAPNRLQQIEALPR